MPLLLLYLGSISMMTASLLLLMALPGSDILHVKIYLVQNIIHDIILTLKEFNIVNLDLQKWVCLMIR